MAEYIVYGNDGWISSVSNGELIRCKDCKFYGKYVRVRREDGHKFVCNKHGIYMWRFGYCSDGEKKNDDAG